MKKTFFLFSVLALFAMGRAQTTTQLTSPVGIGVSSANADLHIHESSPTEVWPGITPDGMGGRDQNSPGDYYTTLRLTNTHTMTGETDGFVIEQKNKIVTLRQHEYSNLYLYGYNDVGLEIDSLGKMGLGATVLTGYKLNIGGKTHVAGDLSSDGSLTALGGTFSGAVTIGSGFACSATGVVRAKEVRVTLDGWSDFVFDDGYRLPSLLELESYVRSHRHLPDIPSAVEVEANGVDLGEMNARLLQKVEELTLYIIDLQKQIDELKNQQK